MNFKLNSRSNNIGILLGNTALGFLISGWFLGFVINGHDSGIKHSIQSFLENSTLFAFSAALITSPQEAIQIVGASFLYLPLIILLLTALGIGFIGSSLCLMALTVAVDKLPFTKSKT